MGYLFEGGIDRVDVLRIGQYTVSVEHNGDGPKWRLLSNGEADPIYPYFHVRQIVELTDEDIERIGEAVKKHLKLRRGAEF